MGGRLLMVQGTMSHVGKTVLVAALCRILLQDGLRVAPFKAQNMALNSFVTPDGLEIGRAQAVQAEAAGIPPAVEMNPVLLKPEADHRSQVVVMGRPIGSYGAADYHRLKPSLFPTVLEALERLRSRYDVVVMEGAGSPAEVNLRAHDIVNMGLARQVGAPVLLVGDIDRGGVFAQLVGTVELLEPQERALVKALVINKFRGDKSLLLPGLRFLESRTGLPVAGVIPYDPGLALPEEDSVALEGAPRQAQGLLDVAAVRLPRIANFDDLDPLRREPGVGLRFVNEGQELGRPDLVVIPGTKTTVADLEHLRATGLAEAIVRAASTGTAVVGICGGFQMLGQAVLDPQGVESPLPRAKGLGLLPVTTVFRSAKTTHQVEARVEAGRGLLEGCRGMLLRGYEIHMGESRGGADAPFVVLSRSGEACHVPDGALSEDGWLLGTYLHGLFHNHHLRRRLLGNLARRKGVSLPRSDDAGADPYDRLAALVRSHLDMGLIYRLLGLEG
ncbi:MAG TPA: cobyric acid synthase [Dehalococcoidia bacterium]|nr:cobyric acid synthase [Dehalococcoidia bacterium]